LLLKRPESAKLSPAIPKKPKITLIYAPLLEFGRFWDHFVSSQEVGAFVEQT
jgi:hypothetical protein